MANKWMKKLLEMDGALVERRDIYANPLKTGSPSVDFIFGKTYGLPFGYTAVLYGPPKGGKSVLLHMMIGWLHQHDREAIAVKIDPEFRSEAQLTPEMMALYGIDPDRLLIIQTNSPTAAFDQVEKKLASFCAAGAPIRLIGIDSISGIQGRREMNTESVEKQLIGDHAQTVQIGLKRVLPVIRKYQIALVLVAQARAEMDQTEQMRGNKFKMQASYGLQHMAEYFVVVEANKNKAGKTDLLKREFINPDVADLAGKGEQTAMKIKAKMKDSSLGPKGRLGEFTFHFHRGVINSHEEVFSLGTGYNVVERDGNMYKFNGQSWNGQKKFLEALEADPSIGEAVMAELQRKEAAGEFAATDSQLAAAVEGEDEE